VISRWLFVCVTAQDGGYHSAKQREAIHTAENTVRRCGEM
jgi:hypothetical protein